MKVRTFRSFAKVNLGLEVVGKLPNGYHELKTVFATLSLHDKVEIAEARRGITVRCDDPGVPQDETNIAHRAAALMQRLSGRKSGVSIAIRKRIAPGGGLGGGSSNAATVLRALDRIWKLGLSEGELVEAAKSLGADVPYFLVGGLALGLGRGDDIHPLDMALPQRVLLIQGPGGVSTAAVFQQFAAQKTKPTARSRIDEFLKGSAPVSSLRNDLEPAALLVSPTLARVARRIRRVARESGALKALMSGSGSSFFMLFGDVAARQAAATALSGVGIESLPCAFLTGRAFHDRFEIAVKS